MIKLYSGDSEDDSLHRWYYCYLHGKAEDIFKQQTPDMFLSDTPMPEAGHHEVMINGHRAIAVIAEHISGLGGRVSLVSDEEALEHAMRPQDWR